MKTFLRGAAFVALTLASAGCTAPEQPLLERFFAASRLRDKTALQTFSTVIFEPREQGIVRTFSVTAVSPEHTVGNVTTKEVTVRARVATADGASVDETLVVTLRRVDERQAGYPWMIVAVRDASGSRSAPRW